jgi:invasion protein IalB
VACALFPLVLALPAGAAGTDQKADKPAQAAPAAGAVPLLPGGASALSETYGGWTVHCQVASNVKSCSMSLQQLNKDTNQRLLAVEVFAKSTDEAVATIALPFGLAVAKGIALAVDDQNPSPVLPFSTCLSAGCIDHLQRAARQLRRGARPHRFPLGQLGGIERTARLPAPSSATGVLKVLRNSAYL